MSATDVVEGASPSPGAPHAELEQRYRRLLRLYPREFRARRQDELLGVLMESAAEGQSRPARGDVADIVRGGLLMRLRGPRGGWPFALAAFALAAPLFLVLADTFQVVFPYWESQATMQNRISRFEAHGTSAAGLPQALLVRQHFGGLQLLGQPDFLLLLAGHLIVAAAVLAGLRRAALAALVVTAAADATHWSYFNVHQPGVGTETLLNVVIFVFEAVALAAVDPRLARRRESWLYLGPVLVLASAAQLWALAFDASVIPMGRGDLRAPIGETIMVIAFVLVMLAVLLPLPLGLGWRTSLLLAAACYPLVILEAIESSLFGRPFSPGRLGQVIAAVPAPVAHTETLAFLLLPPLLILCRAVTQTIRTRQTRSGGDLAV